MFAIDGVKLPSNASKGKSGTRADFLRQAEKLESVAEQILTHHQRNDEQGIESADGVQAKQRIVGLQRSAAQLRHWLTTHPEDRKGSKGSLIKSNRTDNASAKMATDKWVIQGYCGVAAVDATHQIIVEAQAHGSGSEQALLMPVVTATAPWRRPTTLITADAGYHSKTNLDRLAEEQIPALIADNGMRGRDERFKTRGKYKTLAAPLHDKRAQLGSAQGCYRPEDFSYDPATGQCVCPAGKQLYQNGANCRHNGYVGIKFQGAKRDCGPCELRVKCLRHPDRTPTRQVMFFRGREHEEESPIERMKRVIDSPEGRALYGRRFATVEPVFANLRHNKRLNRFTLRGQCKVDVQWKLYCLVHNIEKLAKNGYGQCH